MERKLATSPAAAAGGASSPGGARELHGSAALGEIPIRLALGGATLAMGAAGQWELEHSSLHEYMTRAKELGERNAQLEAENAQLRAKCERMAEESNMEKFKCQLLVEMLAVATLDEERSRGEAEQEKARAASLKQDVVALLEQARKDGVDVRRLAAALPANPTP